MRTKPRPKNAAHWRFIVTRPDRGLSGETSQRARASRLGGTSCRQRRQDREHGGLDALGRLEVLAAVVDERRPRVLRRPFLHDKRRRIRRHLFAKLFDGLPLLGQLGRDHQVVLAEPLVLFGSPLLFVGSAGFPRSRRGVSRAATGCGSVVTEIRNRPSPAAW